MRNLFVLLLLLLCTTGIALSQPICGFDEIHKTKLQKDSSYRNAVENNERFAQRYIAKNKSRISARTEGTTATLYTIPVVVHVMHTGGAVGSIYNPTDAQIQGAINYLNQVYNGTYPGTQGIGDIQIQFALASRDPNCNVTSGIERIDASAVSGYSANGIRSAAANPGVSELVIKNLSRWNTFSYYNIWIVNKIDGQDGTSGQFIAGYAFLPGAHPSYDGIVMLATQMVAGQKTLPHEIGHAFGLYHPFEGSLDNNTCPLNNDCNMNNDFVCDTDPIRFNQSGGVVDFNPRVGINPCTSTAYTSNTESNYMNYTYSYNLFTAGQKARMLAFAASVYRKSLSTSLALAENYFSASSFSAPGSASCSPATEPQGLTANYAGILNTEINSRSLGSSYTKNDNGYVNGANSCLNLVQLVRGNTYTISVSVAGVNPEYVRAWIDYNNDGNFSNATEQILINNIPAVGYPIATSATFTVPTSATLNTILRMRVIDDLAAITNGCANPSYGQAEDYPVYITSGVLPVRLLEFNGTLKDNSASLLWKTETESGVKSFDIEKSYDGVEFFKIGSLLSSGQNSGTHEYRYTDKFLTENNYYRLRMNDVNGTSKLSEVVLLRYDAKAQNVRVLNNPFTDNITMIFDKVAKHARLQLINAYGSIVIEKEISVNSSYVKWDMAMHLPKGTYILKVLADGQIFTSKLIRN